MKLNLFQKDKNEEEDRLIEELDRIIEYVRQQKSALNFGEITEEQYNRSILPVKEGIIQINNAIAERNEELFDEQVHKMIDNVLNGAEE